ncbi:hypothetical protein EDI_265940 [Entamoeba dispar SAW760]|uniref:Nucleosome assembly protein n=1 Tax=Entamoeba dispar (strain ATCC PRA-260 / SAW760) TaxID=370354 RepID=B0EBV4_ENTDS|nr:uncharacterized protein EDI_265940 [Entamoeba dispar SAW760]EDR27999.1 hypothetical protein EDI_265940 [Entamoeba dispar SAW760]|eukprot:EDR27999.1 hypothetical protein EDI_265940 [Entamoeba dispar SAW760]
MSIHSLDKINKVILSKNINEYINIVGDEVKENLEELKRIDKEIGEKEIEYQIECLKIEQENEKDLKEILEIRRAIINGINYNQNKEIKSCGIPNFWIEVFNEVGLIGNLEVSKEEIEILQSLIDIEKHIKEIKKIEGKEEIYVNIHYKFIFKQNQFISNLIFEFELEHCINRYGIIIDETRNYIPLNQFKWKKQINEKRMFNLLENGGKNLHFYLQDALNNINFIAIDLFFGINTQNLFLDSFSISDNESENKSINDDDECVDYSSHL